MCTLNEDVQVQYMDTPGRMQAFFQKRNARGRKSGRGSKQQNRDPWQDPMVDQYGEDARRDSPKVMTPTVFKPKKRKREKLIIDNSQYEKLPMCGIEVRLPIGLKPYPSQKLMMVRILTALTKKLNLLAESPTGSGKTMALLASSCAWIEGYKRKRNEARTNCPIHRNGGEADMALASGLSSELPAKQEPHNPDIDEVYADNIKLETKVEPTPGTPQYKPSLPYDDEFFNDFASSPAPLPTKVESSTEKSEQKACSCLPKVRIYYGTRTHKQIGQVVKEFSRLPYGGITSHTILASREQSCINVAARESADISGYCKELLSAGGMGCRFKDAMKGRFERPQYIRFALDQTGSTVFDIEELVDSLSSMATPICPYFSSTRILTQDADIIFCPFSYLVDPIIRNSSDVHLKNSVVILDEAHNIEDNCREAASFTFYEKEISDSLGNLREKEQMTLKLLEKSNNALDLMEGMEKESENYLIENYSADLDKITALALLMDDISKWFRDSALKLLSNARVDGSGKLSNTVNHGYIEVDLRRFHLHPEDSRYEVAEAAYKGLLSSYQERQDSRPPDNKISSVAIVCLEKWFYFTEYFKDEKKRSMLNVCSEKVYQYHERGAYIEGRGRRDGQAGPKNLNYSQMTGDETDVWLSSTQGPSGHEPIRAGYRTSFSLWCMSPELAFTSAFSECRSVILASGTLCPVETLKTELGLKFHSQMEGEQVIPSEQIFAAVLPVGPSGHHLCATYRNVSDGSSPFVSELALSIRTICQTVPKGILCFFPSYRMLTLVFEYMENASILRQVQQRKVVVKEPRRSSDLPAVMEIYEDAVRNPTSHGRHVDGALMFAVFRGKVSEGIDFADDLARLVISVGIPFPNAMDDLVKEKKIYNDEFCKTKALLTGDQWYVSQAYRALNQALGRCLRHRNDWGALVLVDERLTAQAVRSGGKVVSSARVSTWIQKQLHVFHQFTDFETSLADFVKRMQLKDEERQSEVSDDF